MKDSTQARNLEKSLLKRVSSLADLHSRGIVTGELLGRQLMKLLTSPEAREMFKLTVEPDSRELRILYRMMNPSGWRRKSGLSREERFQEFTRDLAGVMGSDASPEEKLMEMMSLACLPFFKGFVNSRAAPDDKESKPNSRVSVLD
ncbi:MAG: hypothetical protein R6V62_08445 [Candidatus Fermentibacteraceae bacterium]